MVKDYPFRSQWMDLHGVRYHYLDEGDESSPLVVMVHGNPSWSYYFRNLILPLRQNYRVVVPDHVGMGLSDKPQDYPYTLEQHIINLDACLEWIGHRKLVLILHDWGGLIGMGYATRHPDLVKGLVILNTAAFYLAHIPFSLRLARSPMLGDVLLRGFNAFALGALYYGVVHHERMTGDVRKGFLLPYNTWKNRIGVLRFVQDIPLEKNHPTRETVETIEKRLEFFKDTAMLIAWGEKDPVFDEHFLNGWRGRFPNAQVHTFSDAGHYVLEDAHERILPLTVKFLDEVWAK